MSVDNYDFVLEGGTCSLKYSLEPVAFYWRFLTLGNRRGNENRRQWIAPLSGHVSSNGCARRVHKALTASNVKAVSAPAARSNASIASGRPQDGAGGPRAISLTLPLARNLLPSKETRITTLGGADV